MHNVTPLLHFISRRHHEIGIRPNIYRVENDQSLVDLTNGYITFAAKDAHLVIELAD
jgi:hypothetical protein